jgi:crotonobetainyl-CoA:carnitine CoA-transferase CaiB-like acyl-CoA transferase
MTSPLPLEICADLLAHAGLPSELADTVDLGPGATVLPSSFRVTDAATALVGAASAAVAALVEQQEGRTPGVTIDPVGACVAFQSERHLRLREAPKLWDDLGGHYRVADGFVQTHTNFPHHRSALLAALELPPSSDRADVERVMERSNRFEIEAAVAAAGGITAAMRSMDEWRAEPHAEHVAGRSPLSVTSGTGTAVRPRAVEPGRPLAGLRVLDLTRVIAGPVCARTLAAFGADVLRVGAADLPVVDSILPDTTLGKRFAHADITSPAGRDAVRALAADADVVVAGFRPGALAGHGLGVDDLLEINPALIVAELSAFGADGPWGGRRGFDSITQTATGIVAAEMEAFDAETARPLPCQLLDHGSGFLLALGVLAALVRAADEGGGQRADATLLTTRTWLESLGPGQLVADVPLTEERVDRCTATRDSVFGPMRHAVHPGEIEGVSAIWDIGPTTPSADELAWR